MSGLYTIADWTISYLGLSSHKRPIRHLPLGIGPRAQPQRLGTQGLAGSHVFHGVHDRTAQAASLQRGRDIEGRDAVGLREVLAIPIGIQGDVAYGDERCCRSRSRPPS